METMGQKFRAAREKKKMNVSKAAALTRIKIQHLEMMENDDFSKMPAPTYAKGFIRIYASFLGLDPAPLVQEYNDRHLNAPVSEKPAVRTPSRTPPRTPPPAHLLKATEPPAAAEYERTDEVDESRERAPRTPPWKGVDLGAWLRKAAQVILPLIPRIAVAAIAVLLLVGIVRCTVSMTSSSGKGKDTPAEMERTAIMKEPPVRYLELPATEEPTP